MSSARLSGPGGTCPAGQRPPPEALAAAHLAHPAECCRASRLCRRSREWGGEARNAGRTGASHERDPRSPGPPLPGPQWESAQHWSGRAPGPRTQKQSPLAWAPDEPLRAPGLPMAKPGLPISWHLVRKRSCPNHNQISIPGRAAEITSAALYATWDFVFRPVDAATFLISSAFRC